jgi:hypothetical protein
MRVFKVTNSNPNVKGDNNSWIRVYENGIMIAEEPVPKRSPLKWLAQRTKSKHLFSLEKQLFKFGVTLTDVGIKYKGNEHEF